MEPQAEGSRTRKLYQQKADWLCQGRLPLGARMAGGGPGRRLNESRLGCSDRLAEDSVWGELKLSLGLVKWGLA